MLLKVTVMANVDERRLDAFREKYFTIMLQFVDIIKTFDWLSVEEINVERIEK